MATINREYPLELSSYANVSSATQMPYASWHRPAEPAVLGNQPMLECYRSGEWRMVLRRVIQEIRDDDVFGRAAQLSYFLVFSLVPALLITTVLLGFIARGEEMRNTLLSFFARSPRTGVFRSCVTVSSRAPGIREAASCRLESLLRFGPHLRGWTP
jgi:hypothetical protein